MKVGIIGLGTVGEGVLKVLTLEKENIKIKSNCELEVKYACDLNIDRQFSFDFDKNILITDYNKIINDPEVDIVIELIGGETLAKTIILDAFRAKKNVVTANKALIAKHGVELFQVAKENNVAFLFEAAVGGGIPIITPLIESLVANTVTEIQGIMNGTSNYILTRMKEDKLEFSEALALASSKGYAEADPSYDVDGIDAGHKINILASLAYGGSIKFKDMYLNGIRDISSIDIFAASELGYTIKLIASSKLISDDEAEEIRKLIIDIQFSDRICQSAKVAVRLFIEKNVRGLSLDQMVREFALSRSSINNMIYAGKFYLAGHDKRLKID